jgi:hypothetical protein
MRRIERSAEEEEEQLDLMPARKTSAWPLVIVGLVAGLGLLGWGLFSALRPNPCSGKYSSVLFSYCTEIPEGWVGGSRFGADGDLDRYQLDIEAPADGVAETTVEVSQVVDSTVLTQQYVQQFRTSQEADGLSLGEAKGVMLDGEQAIGWSFSIEQGEGQPSYRVRDVILVRGDGAWQIRFVATPEVYEEARIGFEEMLASWRWKA